MHKELKLQNKNLLPPRKFSAAPLSPCDALAGWSPFFALQRTESMSAGARLAPLCALMVVRLWMLLCVACCYCADEAGVLNCTHTTLNAG